MKRYVLSTEDMLVLRDGRPFGEAGMFGGSALDWPLPQTIAGMCRTAMGFQRNPDFFSNSQDAQSVLNIGIVQLLPQLLHDGGVEYLLPTPADLVFSGEISKEVHQLTYNALNAGEGSDIPYTDWLYPTADLKEKPVKSPKFIRSGFASKYLNATLSDAPNTVDEDNDLVSGPVMDMRIHTAIDPRSRSVREGQLFAESSMYLFAPKSGGLRSAEKKFRIPGAAADGAGIQGRLQIGFSLSGLEPGECLPQMMYCGGERRRLDVGTDSAQTFPAPPADLAEQKFLKLLLTTPGDFQTWAPDWLVPAGQVTNCDWAIEPRSGVRMRLRSAVIAGWEGVSGWDYAERKPKPFRKLVRPGSLYLVELQDPEEAPLLVEKLWGNSLCDINSQAERDGFGQVIIAKSTLISK